VNDRGQEREDDDLNGVERRDPRREQERNCDQRGGHHRTRGERHPAGAGNRDEHCGHRPRSRVDFEGVDENVLAREQAQAEREQQQVVSLAGREVAARVQPRDLREVVKRPEHRIGQQEDLERKDECGHARGEHQSDVEDVDLRCGHRGSSVDPRRSPRAQSRASPHGTYRGADKGALGAAGAHPLPASRTYCSINPS
jgi:hypothetical protein